MDEKVFFGVFVKNRFENVSRMAIGCENLTPSTSISDSGSGLFLYLLYFLLYIEGSCSSLGLQSSSRRLILFVNALPLVFIFAFKRNIFFKRLDLDHNR